MSHNSENQPQRETRDKVVGVASLIGIVAVRADKSPQTTDQAKAPTVRPIRRENAGRNDRG